MENFFYLASAYAILWLILFGYIISLVKRQKTLSREIEQLKLEIEEKKAK